MSNLMRTLEMPAIGALGWALLHFLWQGAAIAALAAGLLFAMRRASAASRYLVLTSMLGLMVACPVASWCWAAAALPAAAPEVPTLATPRQGTSLSRAIVPGMAELGGAVSEPPHGESLPQPRDQQGGEGAVLGTPGRVMVASDARFQAALRRIEPALPWCVAAWVVGVSVLSLRLLVGWRIVHRLRFVGVTPASAAWQARLRVLAARLGVTRTVRLVESALVDVPTVIGWLKPMILVPASALTGLTPRELEAILAHELAHVRRHDYLVNLMQTVIETLLFYHPAVWWLSGRIREEREHCCDDLAVEACGSRLAFAQALATMEELRSRDNCNRPAALALAADGGSLLARIRRLALGSAADTRRSNWWGASLISLAFVAALGVAAYIAAEATAEQPDNPKQETAIESKPDPEWGPVVNGLRMRVVPVLAEMSEDAIDVAQRVSTFDSPNDVAFAVEIENVSEKPVKLVGTRYGDNYGTAKGKSNSNWFGQFLFAIDYLDGSGKSVERPEVSSVGGLRTADGVQLETVEPKQTLRVLLRPNKWMSVLSQRPLVGKQRAAVRYLGISPTGKEAAPQQPVNEVVAPAVELEVRGPGYRSTGAPLPGLGEEDVAKNPDGTDVDPGKFLVWGKVSNGLRAALEVVPEEGRMVLSHGTKPTLKLHVQNVGEQTISLASLVRLSELPTTVTNDKAEAIPVQGHLSTGVTPAVRIVLKPRQTVTFDAGNLGLAVTKARAEAFERPTLRTLVAPSGKYSLQAVERFGLSFQMRDGNGKVLAPLEGDWKGELKTGVATVNISNEIIDCEIVDAVTGKLISDTTTSFGFIKPKTADAPEERVGLMAWGPKGPGRIYFTIPEQVMQRPDREELEMQWGTGNHPDYENYAPTERIPLKQFFTDGPKAARETLSKIKLTPKAKAAVAVDAKTDGTKAEVKPQGEVAPLPKGEAAQTLFKTWKRGARINGNIPGGALGPLVRVMTNFVKNNPTHEAAPKFTELLKRIDVTHDWTGTEAAALLDDVTGIYASLPEWVEMEDRFTIGREIQAGRPLPAELENAAWGEAKPNGLRMAWLLEPRTEQYAIGARLRSRILIHNSGKETTFFTANSFNQAGGEARGAKDEEIKVTSTYWTTIGQLTVFRLAPGQYCELTAPGIGIGATNKDDEDWSDVRIGAWIETPPGNEVTFTSSPVSVNGTRDGGTDGPPEMWLNFIKERLSLDAPLPADAAERTPILERATRDLFGTEPTAEELTAFTSDREANALETLAQRLAKRTGTSSFTGVLQGGATKFRVVALDTEAASKPRVCVGPGDRTLGGNARLVIVQKPVGDRRVNEAHIKFIQPDPEAARPPTPYEIKLPDGHLTWAIAWEPGSKVLWVAEKGHIRSYRFADQQKVLEARFDPGSIIDVAEQFYPIGWQSDQSTLWLTQKGILHTYDFSFPGQRRDSRYEAGARIQIPEEFRPGQAPKPDEPKKEGAEANRVLPQRTQFFNDQHSAVGVMSGDDVKFVLAYAGFLSSGTQSWERSEPAAGWGFDGFLSLIDKEKTRAAGKNIDKRKIAVKYTSDAPNTLFLDGEPYDLTKAGRVFVLFDAGEPQRSERTLPLQNQGDLVAIGKLVDDERLSLTRAVRVFNQENQQLGIGLDQPSLIADEVVAAIIQSKWEIESNRLNEKEIAAFKNVAETRRLPEGSYFHAWRNDQLAALFVKNYWRVELYLPAMGHDGFVGFVIRHTKLADEKIDPKVIAWGQPDADGLSLGICLTPQKAQYRVGERVRLRLFVRNDSQKFVETTWANTTHPMPDDFTVTDETGAKVAVRIAHDQWRHAWLSGYIQGGIAAGDIHAFNVPYEISLGGKSAEANKLIGRVIEARDGQTLKLKVRAVIGSGRTRGANEPEPESGSLAFQVAPQPRTPANNNAGVQSIPPRLEFRIVAQPADGKFEPRVPADYQKRDYPGNSVIGRMVAKDKGFIWVEAVGFTDEPLPEQPVERLRGGKIREVLLADTPEHVLPFNGKWSIEDCRVVPDENGGDQFRIEVKLNAAGGEAMRKLTKSHPGQRLAIVVENKVLTVPVIHNEIGRDIAITGRFTREQAEKIAAVLRPR